jgi:4-amino-4-deoxy-L-arabinose transferase-like glycosyltransferase
MNDPLQEPSVLDYVKARLRFWEKAPPLFESLALTPSPSPEGSGDGENEASEPASPGILFPTPAIKLPWRSMLAVLLVLIAQLTFEPRPGVERSGLTGAVLYLLAAAVALWAALSQEWQFEPLPSEEPSEAPLNVPLRPLLTGVGLLLVSFLAFGGNQFNIFNTSLWLAGIFLVARAFWQKSSGAHRGASLFKPYSRIGVIVALAALALFFRAYQLNAVPPEMNSDHAEKLLDVFDVLQGQTRIFFERNTGREAFQFYLTALVAKVFGTGVSFTSLKLGTLLCGLATLPFIYLLGKETAGRGAAWIAVTLAAVAYWPNVITRVALRFSLYPLVTAPVLYFLLRGLRTQRRNDFILAGLALGIGLHTYTPVRILPFVVLAAVGLYWLHQRHPIQRRQALVGLMIVGLISLTVFLPLGRYALEHPDQFAFRAFSRLGNWERPLEAPAWQVFFQNLWNALRMFNWSNGEIWPVSIPHRPALDVVTGAFFILGVVLTGYRYINQRRWQDLFLLLSIPLLLLPSILSLAFPSENPALNRTSGAMVPVFVIAGLGLFSFVNGLRHALGGRAGLAAATTVGAVLLLLSANQNYNLVFKTYAQNYAQSSWNTSEMGEVIQNYAASVGSLDSAWVVPFPHWVDTRLVGMQAGNPTRDYAIQPSELANSVVLPDPKLFLLKPEDQGSIALLQQLYPQGWLQMVTSAYPNKDFYLYFVPAEPGILPARSLLPQTEPATSSPIP